MNKGPAIDTVFSSITDHAILVMDQAGLLTSWNAAAERLFGSDRCKVGQCVSTFDAAEELDAGVHALEIAAALLHGRTQTSRIHLGADMQSFWGDGVINPIHDSDGVHLGFVKIIRDSSARRQDESAALRAASTDCLTGLANRSGFDNQLRNRLETCKRDHQSLVLHLLDLDNFKNINDTLGHLAGDLLLQQVAARLVNASRKADFVARFGGDEFGLLQADVKAPIDACQLADKLLNTLAQPFDIEGHEVHTSASIGIAVAPQDGWDARALLRKADSALYRVKRSGRNGYCYYTDDLDRDAHRRSRDQIALQKAVETRQFHLVYQPKVSAADGTLVGIEALLRCDHPALSDRPILDVIALATEYGTMVDLSEWILTQACRQSKQWFDRGHRPLCLCVNLSSRELSETGTPEMIDRVLRDTGFPAQQLVLELTEHELFDSKTEGLAIIRILRERGISIALDDFGTGFSSLSYLADLPVNFLKLDISFINRIPADPRSAKVVHAIIELAHALNLKVVAEGVERKEQVDFLRHEECEDLQGFYFSRPLSVSNMTTWLQQHARAH